MRAGVSTPWAFDLMCIRTIRFAKIRLVGGGGGSGGVLSYCRGANLIQRFQLQIINATKLWIKSCKDGKKDILLFALQQSYCQGELVGMQFLTIASIVLLNACWCLCYYHRGVGFSH